MARGVPSPKTVDELIALLNPTTKEVISTAEAKRKELTQSIEGIFAETAQKVAAHVEGTSDVDALKAALNSLITAKKRTVAAIKGIADEVFDQSDEGAPAVLDADSPTSGDGSDAASGFDLAEAPTTKK